MRKINKNQSKIHLQSSKKKVFNRLKDLLSQKSKKEGRTISLREVARSTKIDPSTLSDWLNNRVTRYDANKIAVLCDYFECSPGELIVSFRQK